MATATLPPEDMKLVSYADDCTVLASGSTVADLEFKINQYLETLLKWFEDNKLELSPGKSSATLFTTSSKEVSRILNIRVGGCQVPTEKHPKVLGLTFDPMYRFWQACQCDYGEGQETKQHAVSPSRKHLGKR